jgi:hypothetical protein
VIQMLNKVDAQDPDLIRAKLRTDPNFVAIKHYNYDIKEIEARYEECPEHIAARALFITEEELAIETQLVILKLRNLMGISV